MKTWINRSQKKVNFLAFMIFMSNNVFLITVMYSPFFDHVLGYWKQREQSNILFVKYEDLLKDPVNIIKKIAEFLEVNIRLFHS